VIFKTYEENGLEELDLDTEIDCAILGDACFKVTWDNEEEGKDNFARHPGDICLVGGR